MSLANMKITCSVTVLEAAIIIACLRKMSENELCDNIAKQYAEQVRALTGKDKE